MKFLRFDTFRDSRAVFAATWCLFALTGCGTTPPAAKSMAAGDAGKECQSALDEATRLHNAAVDFMNADRPELAVNKFDDSIMAWRRVTDGALHCTRDAVTMANDGLQKTQYEQDQARAKAAEKAGK